MCISLAVLPVALRDLMEDVIRESHVSVLVFEHWQVFEFIDKPEEVVLEVLKCRVVLAVEEELQHVDVEAEPIQLFKSVIPEVGGNEFVILAVLEECLPHWWRVEHSRESQVLTRTMHLLIWATRHFA